MVEILADEIWTKKEFKRIFIVFKGYMNVLTCLFVLVTKNGSIFEMTTKLGGKMLQMLFVVIQNFFWWNYLLSTKRFS